MKISHSQVADYLVEGPGRFVCALGVLGWLTTLSSKAHGTTSFTIWDFYFHSLEQVEKPVWNVCHSIDFSCLYLLYLKLFLVLRCRFCSVRAACFFSDPTPAMPNPCVCVQLPEKSLHPHREASDQPCMWLVFWAVAPCCFNSFLE